MRALLLASALIVALGASAFAQAPLIGERDTARPGGVYSSLTTADAAACAQLCAEDGICMAWTFRTAPTRTCELKAVAPPPIAETGAHSGLSARAPAFAQRLRASAPDESVALAIAAALPEEEIAGELLGGPIAEPPPTAPPAPEGEQQASLTLRERLDAPR
jgi:PAN domain